MLVSGWMMGFLRGVVVAASLLFVATPASAVDGHDWVGATNQSRTAEVERVIGNMKAKGCRVKMSAYYYVRQLNDFYAPKETRNIKMVAALALIATGAGEVWDC